MATFLSYNPTTHSFANSTTTSSISADSQGQIPTIRSDGPAFLFYNPTPHSFDTASSISAAQTQKSIGPDVRMLDYSRPEPMGPEAMVWWTKMKSISPKLNQSSWTKFCRYCGCILLSLEANGWCCNNGKLCRPMLPEYPNFFESELSRRPALYSSLSRRINALFAFSAIGTTGAFLPLPVTPQ